MFLQDCATPRDTKLQAIAIVGACHCTSDGQEHKLIQYAGPE